MKRKEAMAKAEELATLILRKFYEQKRRPFKDLPLLAFLPFFKLRVDLEKGADPEWNKLVPAAREILVFGSVARSDDEDEVGDLDMILVDNGVISQFFNQENEMADLYLELDDHLEELLVGWLDYEEFPELQKRLGLTVDLHVLPAKFFKDPQERRRLAKMHKDPNFLKNCFSAILRWDQGNRAFVPVDIVYFEKKFGAELQDLRA